MGGDTAMWNDTDIPLAYLITFRCYGTWLHGDNRGSVDRSHNRFREPYAAPSENRQLHHSKALKVAPVTLNAAQREAVEAAIRETCKYRGWLLRTINVRTNHVHVVVSVGAKKPEIALNAFKANATRQMRQAGCWHQEFTPWADKGSKRNLWNEHHIELAVDYVINGQGDDLPKFE